MPAPLFLYLVSYLTNFLQMIFGTNLHYIWYKFCIIIKRINTGTASSNGANWNEFNEHQSIKKHHLQCLICKFLVQIRFGWKKTIIMYVYNLNIYLLRIKENYCCVFKVLEKFRSCDLDILDIIIMTIRAKII